jgi:tetratricopeptide (TPR) repeat protein
MRKFLAMTVALPVLATGGFAGYRILQRDYRYHELIRFGDDLLARDQPVEASRTYGSAIELKPDEALAYLKRAEAERLKGNLLRALEDVERAGALSGDVLLVSSRLGELLYESHRFDEAAFHYEKVLALVPDSPSILYQLGLTRFRSGRTAEAIEALNRAAVLRRDFWEAYYLRGAVFLSIGGVDEAESDFRTALDVAPEAGMAREALIDLYLDRNAPDLALPLVEEEIAARPEDPLPFLGLAEIHRLRGRTAEAIEAVGKAIGKDPNLPAAYLRLGELWLDEAGERGDQVAAEKALAALIPVVKMDPSSGAAALALGRAYLALGDEERGFAELLRASQATPIPVEALRLLGDLYRARKNPTEAVNAYHVYLKLSGDSTAVLERLGDAYLESGSPRTGAEVYLRLAELEPRRATPLVKAARAYLLAGDRDAAAQTCRRGLAANPENQALMELLAETGRPRPSGFGLPSPVR